MKRKGQGSRPRFETRQKTSPRPKMKIDKVARTKLGVYTDLIAAHACEQGIKSRLNLRHVQLLSVRLTS